MKEILEKSLQVSISKEGERELNALGLLLHIPKSSFLVVHYGKFQRKAYLFCLVVYYVVGAKCT